MKISSGWQVALACSLLAIAAGSAVMLNPAAQNAKKNIPEVEIKQSGNSFAINNVRVFDGEKTIEKTSLLIQDGKIAAIGENIKIPDNTPVYDGAGKTLLPGLIDSHTHTYGDARKEALRFGVTTEMDMFTDWHQLVGAKKQRESYARTDMADLWSAGTLATVPGGHGTEYGIKIPTLSAAAEAPAFVQARVAEGSDYIKIVMDDGSAYGPNVHIKSLTQDITKALIAAAHQQGKKAVFHIASLNDAKQATEQGADGLMHIFFDHIVDADFIEKAKQANLFIVPTLSVTGSLSGADEGKALAADIYLQDYLTSTQSTALNASFPKQWQNPNFLNNALASTKLLHEAGITILAGTDAGNPSTTHGASLHGELSLLVKAGFTPSEALHAATALPAKIFGLNDRGRIAIGMRADMILVNGDPTENITNTRHIAVIWKNGYRFARTKTIAMPAAEMSAALPTGTLISDFEDEKITSRYGSGWHITTDKQMDGESIANMALISDGADNSKAALKISGEIKSGFAYPWAGVFFAAGENSMQPVDYSQSKELVFQVKGDGRSYSVMAFAAGQATGIPPSQSFKTSQQWQQVRLPLDGFEGLELSQVAGFSFNASAPTGKFDFIIDNVEIK